MLDVTFRSATGKSILEYTPSEFNRDISCYAATKETQANAVKALTKLGFKLVGPPSPYGVTIAGSPKLVDRVFGTNPPRVPPSLLKWIETVRVPIPGEFLSGCYLRRA